MKQSALFLAVILMVVACQKATHQVDDASVPHMTIPYPSIDAYLGEKLHDNEQELAYKIAAVIEKSIQETHRKRGLAIRDAHPKAHGCVKGRVHIDESLPPSLAQGVFQPGHLYDAWIRFSNSHADPDRADIRGDARGMAIKLVGVPGKKLLETQSDATTQDFVMVSHPVFFIDDPADYLSLQTHDWLDRLLVPFRLGLKGILIFRQMTGKQINNPLQTRYWSEVPYQLGIGADRQAVKFSAQPLYDAGQSCLTLQEGFPSDPSRDFLREALRHTLMRGKACMQFLIQPRTPSMSVENSQVEWKESEAPFVKVATIEIPQQEFDTPEKNRFCEHLSFNPWHALPEHRPLGVINRLRKVIYPQISEIRHMLNSAPQMEPERIQSEE